MPETAAPSPLGIVCSVPALTAIMSSDAWGAAAAFANKPHTYVLTPEFEIRIRMCVFITAGPIIKLCAGGEGDSEGHVL